MINMKPEQQRQIGILIDSGIYKHPDGRHLYQLDPSELQDLRQKHKVCELTMTTQRTLVLK